MGILLLVVLTITVCSFSKETMDIVLTQATGRLDHPVRLEFNFINIQIPSLYSDP